MDTNPIENRRLGHQILQSQLSQWQEFNAKLTKLLVAAEGDDLLEVIATIIKQRDQWQECAHQQAKALNLIACWDEGAKVTTSFDEPCAAAIARGGLSLVTCEKCGTANNTSDMGYCWKCKEKLPPLDVKPETESLSHRGEKGE